MWIYNSSSESGRYTTTGGGGGGGDHHRSCNFPPLAKDDDVSSSSSSIGNNSDDVSGGGGCHSDDDGGGEEEEEVESVFKGSFNNLSDLEDALLLNKGISTFYSGKSKSFTSLADAVSAPSIQDIVKPEDAYNRKRKNMLAHTLMLNNKNHRNFTSNAGHHIHKNAAAAGAGGGGGGGETQSSSPGGGSLPPLPACHRMLPPIAAIKESSSSSRNYCSPWRSYSLSDLQHADSASSFTGNKRDEEEDD